MLERFEYTPYGEVTVLDANWSADADTVSDYGWNYFHQGGRRDGNTGLYHFRHRDYSPTLGRWVQKDPMGYVDGMSLYHYVSSNPIILTDPFGLMPNKQDAITLEELVKEIERIEKGKTPCEALEAIKERMKGQGEYADDTPYWKYIYTTKHDWIDLPHFFESANWSPWQVNVMGPLIEQWQGLAGAYSSGPSASDAIDSSPGSSGGANSPSSAGDAGTGASTWGPEDLHSNNNGAKFGESVDCCGLPLSQQVRDYFRKMGATDPKSAHNYWVLPESESQWQKEWPYHHDYWQARKWAYVDPAAWAHLRPYLENPRGYRPLPVLQPPPLNLDDWNFPPQW